MQQKKLINEYDSTKKMLNVLRNFSNTVITENEIGSDQPQQNSETPAQENNVSDQPQKNDFVVINDVEVKLLSSDEADLELSDEQKTSISNLIDNFKQQISQIVDFEPGFTISQNQIRLDGSLSDNDINFVLIAGNEAGVYINADMLKLESQVGNMLEKLAKFEETFKATFEPLIQSRNNN